jgi:hypothetical protein
VQRAAEIESLEVQPGGVGGGQRGGRARHQRGGAHRQRAAVDVERAHAARRGGG